MRDKRDDAHLATVFIDDSLHNVQAARAHGWRAVHLPVPEALERDLFNEIGL